MTVRVPVRWYVCSPCFAGWIKIIKTKNVKESGAGSVAVVQEKGFQQIALFGRKGGLFLQGFLLQGFALAYWFLHFGEAVLGGQLEVFDAH